ncbi:unnamed protein product [Parajaminaea phylloscopi]
MDAHALQQRDEEGGESGVEVGVSPSCPSLALTPTDKAHSTAQGPITPREPIDHGDAAKTFGSPSQVVSIDPRVIMTHNTVEPQPQPFSIQASQVTSSSSNSHAQEETRASSPAESEASSDATPPPRTVPTPEEQLFTTTGRPARRATSTKSASYAPECDRLGNPIKKAKRSISDKGSQQPEAHAPPPKSEAKAPPSAPPAITRSGRAVTKPRDRHRSSDRDAKASLRELAKRKATIVDSEEEHSSGDDEDANEAPDLEDCGAGDGVADEGDGEKPNEAARRVARRASHKQDKAGKSRAPPGPIEDIDNDELDLLRKEAQGQATGRQSTHKTPTAQRRRPNVEILISPPSESKRRKKAEPMRDVESVTATDGAEPRGSSVIDSRDASTAPSCDVDTVDGQGEEPDEEENKENQAAGPILGADRSAPKSTSSSSSSDRKSPGGRPSPSAQDSARSAFAGKALTSLLQQQRHRRPGLTRKSTIPPLHPNRKPAPPPRPPPPMSRKDRDALKKEREARGEDGSDDDDDEDKPVYNPFEEEIEGY